MTLRYSYWRDAATKERMYLFVMTDEDIAEVFSKCDPIDKWQLDELAKDTSIESYLMQLQICAQKLED